MPTKDNAKNLDILNQLKDIKGLSIIDDSSLYILLSIIFFAALIIIIIVYKKMTKITKTKLPSQKEISLKRLKNLDIDSLSKDDLYLISTSCDLFVNNSNQSLFDEINNQSEQYKYIKEIKPIDDELKTLIKEFIGELK
jgi:hypothetical protein